MSSPPDTSSPRARIDALLRSLYGGVIGRQTGVQLVDLLAARRTERQLRKTSALSERDALLITYADQVRASPLTSSRAMP